MSPKLTAEQIAQVITLAQLGFERRGSCKRGVLASIDALLSGDPRKAVADRWGISEATLSRWLKLIVKLQ